MHGIPYTFENIGKRDREYGGTLTDISTLPVGTEFHVQNGCWNGKIIMKSGKKYVHIKSKGDMELYPEGSKNNILALDLNSIKYPD